MGDQPIDRNSNTSTPTRVQSAISGGNVLSNVAPPSSLPNFIVAASADSNITQQTNSTSEQPKLTTQEEHFSPAIPACKGQPTLPLRTPDDTQQSLSPVTENAPIFGDPMPGSGLLSWVKDAVTTSGLLQKVAEKARSSVDTIVTTLDPQMKDYITGVSDMNIIVASDKDVKITPVREAFQAVFGRVDVIGLASENTVTAAQPVGHAAAYAAAKQRIAHLRANNSSINNNVPIVAVENFVNQYLDNRWYDQGLLIITQPSLNIELVGYTQTTPVPLSVINNLRSSTPDDYEHRDTGFSQTVGSAMGALFQTHHTKWHEVSTGVSRREMLVLAARSLAGTYKNLLLLSAMDTDIKT